MEQMIIDFFIKASELILHNRLPSPSNTKEAILTQLTKASPTKFQLSFDHKFNFSSRVPPEWTTRPNKLLIIEFFLSLKATNTKFLVEQWIFDMSYSSDNRLNDTIDSQQTLYHKLSVLLRTISLLTVTLPLYRNREKSNAQLFTLEHSINFTRHTLSNWHPSVYDDRDLHDYTSSDFVLPGRIFSFKVNYSKSLKFLQRVQEELEVQENQGLGLGYVKSPQTEGLTNIELSRRLKELNVGRKGYCDNMRTVHPAFNTYLNNLQNEMGTYQPTGDYENNVPVSLQKSIREATPNSPVPRKSSGSKPWDMSKASRPRVKTMESETFWEGEVFICENEEENFTEVLSWKEVSMRNKSPARLSLYNIEKEDHNEFQNYRKISEEFEKGGLRLSSITKPIEKIIEETDDDKIAELLHSIDELKVLTRGAQSGRSSLSSRTTARTDREDSENKSGEKDGNKGLRFESNLNSRKESGEELLLLNPSLELNELRDLYLQIKRSGSAK